jgi:hypothetical protein
MTEKTRWVYAYQMSIDGSEFESTLRKNFDDSYLIFPHHFPAAMPSHNRCYSGSRYSSCRPAPQQPRSHDCDHALAQDNHVATVNAKAFLLTLNRLNPQEEVFRVATPALIKRDTSPPSHMRTFDRFFFLHIDVAFLSYLLSQPVGGLDTLLNHRYS